MGQRPAAGGHIHPPPPPPLRADCFSRGAESGRGATGSRASTYSVLTTRSRAKSAVTTEVPTPNEPQLTGRKCRQKYGIAVQQSVKSTVLTKGKVPETEYQKPLSRR